MNSSVVAKNLAACAGILVSQIITDPVTQLEKWSYMWRIWSFFNFLYLVVKNVKDFILPIQYL